MKIEETDGEKQPLQCQTPSKFNLQYLSGKKAYNNRTTRELFSLVSSLILCKEAFSVSFLVERWREKENPVRRLQQFVAEAKAVKINNSTRLNTYSIYKYQPNNRIRHIGKSPKNRIVGSSIEK